jgi:hypothetical protein
MPPCPSATGNVSVGPALDRGDNLSRYFPQVVGENFTNESKKRWATDFKILLQRRDVTLPRKRELVGQVRAIKRRVLPSGGCGARAGVTATR